MKGHLITCIDVAARHDFENQRYVGLGPFYPNPNATKRQIRKRLQILWDVIADLKRVERGDICFLHTKGSIWGPYIFKTGFRESQTLPPILSSPKLTFQNWWDNRDELDNIKMKDYGYVAAIDKPEGCNSNGEDLMGLFLRQSLGIFNSIPPRFMYGDTKKIVKPLLNHEISQLLEMVNFNGNWNIAPGPISPIEDFNDIFLDLTNYDGHLFCEKILEGWFMENMAINGKQRGEIANLIGNYTYYANSIYTYYTNFLDVIAYYAPHDFIMNRCEPCKSVVRNFANDIRVFELKRDMLSDNLRTIDQVRRYMEWAKTILNPTAQVAGYIVAAGFDNNYRDFIRNNRDTNIHLLQYILKNGMLHLQLFE